MNDPDNDADGDGVCGDVDTCSDDPDKTEPGTCGCGVADTDSDSDGTPDCNDSCSNDPNKTEPGACGCGIADTDGDGDGTADCNDTCSSDPNKIDPGVCDCGIADTDSDGDGIQDCTDSCPIDSQNDADGDGVCGNIDNCPFVANPDQADSDNNGIGDACEPYQFSGFFPPVDNPPVFNLTRAGSSVPIRFSLNGYKGLNIFMAGVGSLDCDTASPVDVLEETVSAGFSTFSYDASTDQYTYVWQTDRSMAHTCRTFVLFINDGTSHIAYFKFR